jgi:hypothetical protein
MKGDTNRREKILGKGPVANISQAYRDLAARVRRFIKGLEVVIDGKNSTPTSAGTGREASEGEAGTCGGIGATGGKICARAF